MEGSPARTTVSAVRLSAVRKRFARRREWVLDGVDLSLAPGSTTVVVGANGSGKSTLLRIAAGLSAPNAGQVQRGHASIGYAPDRLGARARMSGRVYVEHMGRVRGADAHDARARADELFDRLGLWPGPDAPIRTLSKGNSQKIALTQALLMPVDLLILDEPYGGLDAPARDAVSDILGERAARGAAVLVSAHARLDISLAADTLRLERGQLHASNPTRAATRIILASTNPTTEPQSLRKVAGVTDVRGDGGRVTLVVDAGSVDAVLTFALSTGWSVVAVDPGTGARET